MWLSRLYLLSIVLLTAHEIDSAYWMEWRLFGLPGGLAGFVGAHIPLLALLIWGYGRLCLGARSGLWLSLLLGVVGLFAVGAHAAVLVAGRMEFRTPASLGLLTAVAGCCAVLLPVTLRQLKPELIMAPAGAPAGDPAAGWPADRPDHDGPPASGPGYDGAGYDRAAYDPLADEQLTATTRHWTTGPDQPAGGRQASGRRGRRARRG